MVRRRATRAGIRIPAGASCCLSENHRGTFQVPGSQVRDWASVSPSIPYAIYFSVEGNVIVIVAVFHTAAILLNGSDAFSKA